MEFLINGMGIILEDSASIICSDETNVIVKKKPGTYPNPINLIQVESESFPYWLLTTLILRLRNLEISCVAKLEMERCLLKDLQCCCQSILYKSACC